MASERFQRRIKSARIESSTMDEPYNSGMLDVGDALHFVQEDQPKIIGRTIADWYRRNIATKK